jgi:uncharacterized protein involved in outer membrane biogenesis
MQDAKKEGRKAMENQNQVPTEGSPEEPEKKPDFVSRAKEALRRRWVKWTAIGIGGFIVFWCVFGFLALPGIIKSKAQDFVAEKFHRTIDFKDVSFNPLTLTLTMEGLHLSEPNSKEDFVSFDRLMVNLSSESIFRLAPVIEELELEKPVVHLIRTEKNHYNFDDFIAFALKPEKDKKPTYFSVNNIQIKNGTITFDDRPKGKDHVIDTLNLSIPFISNIPSKVDIFVDLALSANVNHEKFELGGKARAFSKDKDGNVHIKLEALKLLSYMEYVPFKTNFNLKDGRLDTDLKVSFIKPETGDMGLTVSGDFVLNSLLVTELNGKPAVNLPRFAVTLDKSDVLAGNINITEIALKQPQINLGRNTAGQWNLEQMAQLTPIADANSGYDPVIPKDPDAQVTPATEETALASEDSSSSALVIGLKKLAIEEGVIKVDDGLKQVPSDFVLKNFGLQIDDVTVNLSEKNATVGNVFSEGARIQFAMKLLPSAKNVQQKAKTVVRQAAAQAAGGSFGFLVDRIELKNWGITFQNTLVGKKVTTQVDNLNVTVEKLSSDFTKPAPVTVSAKVNKRGSLDVKGTVAPSPLKADVNLNIKDVDITFIQPFIDEKVNMALRRADLSVQGRAQVSKMGDSLKGTFAGNAAINRLVTIDQMTKEPFVDWNVLKLQGIKANLEPLNVVVDHVMLDQFFARVILRENGVLNIHDILRSKAGGRRSLTRSDEGLPFDKAEEGVKPSEGTPQPEAQSAEVAQADAEKPVAEDATKTPPISALGAKEPHDVAPDEVAPEETTTFAPAQDEPPPNYSLAVRKFTLTNGRVRFTDNFIRPHYTANLMNLNGKVEHISTSPDTRSHIEIHGKVNGAPLKITGAANLLSQKLSLDIKASVKGMELSQFSSYSGKYIGYGIAKGKLSFDVAYKIEDRKLKAENQLILDQLTLGKEVESPDALKLPVRLALALLKDRNGVIDLNLPIGGSLDDPQFSIGGIVIKVIVNVLTKAVTAPFNLLASLIGGSDVELSYLPFDPGVSSITDKETKVLESLTKALNERPALQLEITGKYDPEVDAIGLGKQRILRKMREMKRKETGLPETEKVSISDSEYADKLKQIYKSEKFDKPSNWIGMDKSLPTAEMEQLLSKHYAKSVTEDDLLKLANRRGLVVKEWLLEKGKIPDGRLYVLQSEKGTGGANKVDFSLR